VQGTLSNYPGEPPTAEVDNAYIYVMKDGKPCKRYVGAKLLDKFDDAMYEALNRENRYQEFGS
jgi:hypothetical protein